MLVWKGGVRLFLGGEGSKKNQRIRAGGRSLLVGGKVMDFLDGKEDSTCKSLSQGAITTSRSEHYLQSEN